jgi:hypothetical protein
MATTEEFSDCNLIARAFEKGSHYSSKEAAVFATLSRPVQNTRVFSRGTQKTLKSFGATSKKKAFFIDSATASVAGAEQDDDSSFANVLAKEAKECLPCFDRILSGLDLNPLDDFLNALEDILRTKLAMLNSLSNLFGPLDVYGDLCALLGFLNSMCVADLQKLLALLTMLDMEFSISLDAIFDLLMSLVGSLFAPLLESILGLLNQLMQLILAPINCIIEALSLLIRDLDVLTATGQLIGDPDKILKASSSSSSSGASASVSIDLASAISDAADKQDKNQSAVRSGLVELQSSLIKGRNKLQEKFAFFMNAITKLAGDWGLNDESYIANSGKKLINLRLQGFLVALIEALSKGKPICDPRVNKPAPTELENFFDTFLNPNSPFRLSVDKDGNITIEEPINGSSDTDRPTTSDGSMLPNVPKVLGLTQESLLRNLVTPIKVTIKCKLDTTSEDIDKVNRWMEELNQVK